MPTQKTSIATRTAAGAPLLVALSLLGISSSAGAQATAGPTPNARLDGGTAATGGEGTHAAVDANSLPPPPSRPLDADAWAATMRRGEALLASGEFAMAEQEFATALAVQPNAPLAAFGLGTARYRLKEWDGAREAFRAAAERGDASLSAGATYNLGNASYAEALELLAKSQAAMQAAADAGAPAGGGDDSVELVKTRLQEAIRHYRDAAVAAPTRRDARANAERATRLLREIEQQQEQEQEQEQKQDQKQDQQQEQKQDQQKQDQQQQDQQQNQDQQQQQQQQQQDQQQAQQQDGNQQQKGQQKKQEQQKQDGQKQDQQQKQDEQKQDEQKQEQPSQEPSQEPSQKPGTPSEQEARGGAGGELREVPLTKEQVDRMLQAVRDREKARRARIEEQRPRRPAPASKDW